MKTNYLIKYLFRSNQDLTIAEIKLTDVSADTPKNRQYFWLMIKNNELTELQFLHQEDTPKVKQRLFEQGKLQFDNHLAAFKQNEGYTNTLYCAVSLVFRPSEQLLVDDFVAVLPQQNDDLDCATVVDSKQSASKIVNEVTIEPTVDKKERLKLASLLAGASAASGVDFSLESLVPKKFLRPAKHYNPKYDPQKVKEQQAWNELKDQQRKALKEFKESVPRSERIFHKTKK